MLIRGFLRKLLIFFDLILDFMVEFVEGLVESCGFVLKSLDFNLLVGGNLRKLMVFFDLILQFLVEFMDVIIESCGFILK